jgi:hypothetical protein
MYPTELTSPYLDRFPAAAGQRYKALGIERDDSDRLMKIAALNSEAFGAPVVLFCYLDRTMGPDRGARPGAGPADHPFVRLPASGRGPVAICGQS